MGYVYTIAPLVYFMMVELLKTSAIGAIFMGNHDESWGF